MELVRQRDVIVYFNFEFSRFRLQTSGLKDADCGLSSRIRKYLKYTTVGHEIRLQYIYFWFFIFKSNNKNSHLLRSSGKLRLGRYFRNTGSMGVGIRLARVYHLATTICAKTFIT
jgi:hypothetical protein